jgi:ATP-dependent DNA helicase 2 subunit 1
MVDLLQIHSDTNAGAPRATDEQIKKAAALIKRIDLKDFSVFQFANPGKLALIIQTLYLEECL